MTSDFARGGSASSPARCAADTPAQHLRAAARSEVPPMGGDSWSNVLRLLLSGIASYAALVMVPRVTGRRTLSPLNAFDRIVAVIPGSALAPVIRRADAGDCAPESLGGSASPGAW